MIHADWLQTLAEISLGFAGFSALIAGLHGGDAAVSRRNRSQCLAVVETSVSVLGSCILPVLFHGLGLSEAAAYRAGAVVFVVAGVPLTLRGFRRGLRSRERPARERPGLLLYAAFSGSVGLGAMMLCAAGHPEPLVPTYYLAGLAGTLGIGAVNFVSFVVSQTEESDGA